jgi:hypothetical protein
MLKLIQSLLYLIPLLEKVVTWWRNKKLVEQGRNEAKQEAQDALSEQKALAEKVAGSSDAARTDRLRSRFDTSVDD